MPTCPPEVRSLIERFQRNRDAYRAPGYNETQARREFIDPLFKALGWDVDNESGLAEACKDVIHEDAIKVAGPSKTADAQLVLLSHTDTTERQTNQLVYQLCVLTADKIGGIEEPSHGP